LCPLLRPVIDGSKRQEELPSLRCQAIPLVHELHDARTAQFTKTLVQHAWGHLLAARPKLPEAERLNSKLPQDSQGPSTTKEIEEGHQGSACPRPTNRPPRRGSGQ